MADSSFRSFRRDAPARENAPAPRDGLSDPLAELARLIGQGGGQDAGHSGGHASESYEEAPPAEEFDWASVNENDGYAAADRAANGHDRSRDAESWALDSHYQDEAAVHRQGDPPRSAQARGQQPFPFIPRAPDNQQANNGQQHGAYAASYADDYADEDYDEDAPAPRRSGTVVMVVLLGLAVLGTAGALGYRAIGGAVIPALPPIIKPADGPIKIKPSHDAQDSVPGQGDTAKGTGSQIVTNQEQPLDTQSPSAVPRMIKTIPVVPGGLPDTGAVGGQPPGGMTQGPPPQGYAEPAPPTAQPFGAQDQAPQTPPPAKQTRTGTAAPVARPKVPPKPIKSAAPESPPGPKPLSLVPGQENSPQPATPRAARTETPAPVRLTSSAPEAPAPTAGAGYAVQVSSQRSEAEAQAAFRALQAKYPQQLGSRHVFYRRADLGEKGTYYRALVGPFATSEQASAFCSNLKAAGGSCFTQRD
jgi:hypothetical protein